ncbi:hypothetical protein KKG41_03345 [Patescibacteria group bacterium]|nr:hypothetical protein [Patescibacteria group bacterium]MBU1890108.1 hypothetical protein [Patescibacteria group bacterium]
MIILNLLSPEKKKDLTANESFYQVKKAVVVLFVACLIVIGISLATKILVSKEIDKIDNEIVQTQSLIKTNGNGSTDELIKQINQKVTKLSSVQSEYNNWSPILHTLGLSVDKNIQLKSLLLNRSEKLFEIGGVANTRNSLLDFKKDIEALPFFENVNAPLSNLMQKENITFNFDGVFIIEQVDNDGNTE